MRTRILAAASFAAAFVYAGSLSTAGANPDVGAKDNGLSIAEEVYLERYQAAQEKFGSAAVGANVVDDGTAQWDAYNVPDEVVTAKAEVLAAMLNPPPAPTVASAPAGGAVEYQSESTPSTGGYSIPESIVQCESGGDYSAVNPSSGAYGAYQILPSTSAAYGCDMSTTQGQDECAAAIYADSGGAAWVC